MPPVQLLLVEIDPLPSLQSEGPSRVQQKGHQNEWHVDFFQPEWLEPRCCRLHGIHLITCVGISVHTQIHIHIYIFCSSFTYATQTLCNLHEFWNIKHKNTCNWWRRDAETFGTCPQNMSTREPKTMSTYVGLSACVALYYHMRFLPMFACRNRQPADEKETSGDHITWIPTVLVTFE